MRIQREEPACLGGALGMRGAPADTSGAPSRCDPLLAVARSGPTNVFCLLEGSKMVF